MLIFCSQVAYTNDEVAELKSSLREQVAVAQKYNEEVNVLKGSIKQKEEDIEKHNVQVQVV